MAGRKTTRHVTVTNSADALPLALIIADFLQSKELAPPETFRAYRGDLDRLHAHLARVLDVAPSSVMHHDVTRGALEHFRDALLASGESPATVRRRLATVSALFHFTGDKYATNNRASGVKQPAVEAPNFKGLTDAEYGRVLDVASKLDPRDRFVVELLALTGLRRSESIALTLSQLEPGWRFIRGVRGKGRKLRNIPVSAELSRCLARYFEERSKYPMEGVFPLLVSAARAKAKFPDTWKVNPKTVWKIVHDTMIAAGVDASLAHPHTLRHAYARRKLEQLGQQVSPARALTMVSQLLGHAQLSTTMIYLGNGEDEMYDLMENLD